MIFFSFGLPSAFADWCETILIELARRAMGQVVFVNANTLEDLGASFVKTGAQHMVFASRLPATRLCNLLAETNTPFLFVLDDPRSALGYLTGIRGWEFLPTAKLVASSHAAMTRCPTGPNALKLNRGDRQDIRHAAQRIGRHFGLPVTDSDIPRITEALRERGLMAGESEFCAWWDGLDEQTQRMVDGTIDGYISYVDSGRLGSLTWRRDLFLAADNWKPLTGAVDITGRPRLLVYGPYINLPPGPWAAHVVFGCSKAAAGASLIVDVFSGTQLAQSRVQPNDGGIFDVQLKFTVEPGFDGPLEVRILSERAALEGLLSLSHVTLIPESDPEPSNATLNAELGLELS
jgi:hypothetical protein